MYSGPRENVFKESKSLLIFVEFCREMEILMKLLKCGDADFKLVFQSYCFYST